MVITEHEMNQYGSKNRVHERFFIASIGELAKTLDSLGQLFRWRRNMQDRVVPYVDDANVFIAPTPSPNSILIVESWPRSSEQLHRVG